MDDAKPNEGFDASEEFCSSLVGFVVAGACPNRVLKGPLFDGCVTGAELPKMLPGVVDVAGVCPKGLLGGLKAVLDWLKSELEEEGAPAGWANGFAAGCEVFNDCPNHVVGGLGSSGFCAPKLKGFPGWAAGWLWPKLKILFDGWPVADAPKPVGVPDCGDCPNEKGEPEGAAPLPIPKAVLNTGGFFCGDSIIVSPSDWGFTGPFV